MGSSKEEIIVADADPIREVEAAREAFEREFGRFARFIEQGSDAVVSLKEAEAGQRAKENQDLEGEIRKREHVEKEK